MANGYIPLLIHICWTQRAIGTGDLNIEPEWPWSRTHPLRDQLRGALLFALSRVFEIIVDKTIQRRPPKIRFGKGKYGGATLVRVLQATEDLSGRARGLHDLVHLSVVCHSLY